MRRYLAHFFAHWTARHDALVPAEIDAIVDVYAGPDALRRSFAWYRSRLKDRARIAGLSSAERRIQHATVVLWSDRDPVSPLEWSENLVDTFSDLDLSVLRGIGHFIPIEAPAAVIDAVSALLRRVAPESAIRHAEPSSKGAESDANERDPAAYSRGSR